MFDKSIKFSKPNLFKTKLLWVEIIIWLDSKNNGTISYTQRGVYIGIDVKTGKKSPHPSLPKLYEVLTENHAG